MINTISFSGASLKGCFHIGVAEELLNQGIRPTAISAVSYGSYVAPFQAIGDLPTAFINDAINTTQKQAFPKSPYSKWNVLTALIGKRNNIGDQIGALKIYSKHYTQAVHDKLKTLDTDVWIAVHEYKSRKVKHFNLKLVDRDTALKLIHASASIPPFTKWVEIGGKYYCDPGITNHITSDWIVGKYNAPHLQGGDHLSVFSRPEIFDITKGEYIHDKNQPDNLPDNLGYIMNNMVLYTSIKDERLTNRACKDLCIKHQKIHAPYKLLDQFYKFDPDLNRAFIELGKQQVEKWIDNYYIR